MKKIIKWTVAVIFAAFLAIQFIRPDYSAPPIDQTQTLETAMPVPDPVAKIFTRSCNDCHTNSTRYPWYSNVAPLSWSIVSHIKEGRRHLNFSEWNSYDTRKKRQKLDQVCGEMTDGEMPLNQYLWIHWDAKISAEDLKTVCEWTGQERDKLAQENK
jgi:hypothetical protein